MLKHQNITYFYQFIAEAMIAFLIINPFMYASYDVSHYVGYLLIIFIMGGCFFVIEKYNQPVGYYLFAFLISSFLFYLFQFPIGLIFLFPLLFIWRFIRIRSYQNNLQSDIHLHMFDAHYNREMIYIHMTVLIGVINVILTQELFVMYYVFFQFIILLAGHLGSHLSLLNQEERKEMNLVPFLLIPVLLAVGTVAIYYVFDPFRQILSQIWQGTQTLIVVILTNITKLLGFIFPDITRRSTTDEQEEVIIDSQDNGVERNPFEGIEDETGIDESILVIVVTSIVIVIIILFIIRAYKNRREQFNIQADQTVTYHPLDPQKRENEGLFKRFFKRQNRQPTHPVRKLVFKFEQIAGKNGFGRYPFESIKEWVNRLQVDINVTIYEKVRYGQLEVNDQEIDSLAQQLKAIDFTEIAKNAEKSQVK